MHGTKKVVVRCPNSLATSILKGPEKRVAKNDDPPDPIDQIDPTVSILGPYPLGNEPIVS